MRTVAVLNEKGGSGKTTIATNLAGAWHKDGRDVLLLDADPQLTALDWSDTSDGDGVPVVQLGESNLRRDLPRVGQSFDLVVVDGAPRMGSLTESAVAVADLVVIPTQPTAPDIWSAETVVEVCETEGTPAAFVLSRAVVGTKEAGKADEALSSFGIPVLDARTHHRIAYPRAIGQGITVLDLPGADKAANEIRNLSDEVLSHLDRVTND
ncbi:chromosome partitioning protein [Salinibacter ruber]|uniref:ParA family partition ATPase n=1 Tax=Salinibacter ruber TaxID=146919 RepID=UPI002166C5B8|nr:chromosome partitioning protein [Salinibacter ruber]